MLAGVLSLGCRLEPGASALDPNAVHVKAARVGSSLVILAKATGAHVATCECPPFLPPLFDHVKLRVAAWVPQVCLPHPVNNRQSDPPTGSACIEVRLLDSFFFISSRGQSAQQQQERESAQGYAVNRLLLALQRVSQGAQDASNHQDGDSCYKERVQGVVGAAVQPPEPNRDEDDEVAASAAAATAGGHDVREEIFELARPIGWTTEAKDPEGLRCKLLKYQRRALAWMRWREQQAAETASCAIQAPPNWPADGRIALLWRKITLQSGARVWLNQLEGLASKHDPSTAGFLLHPVRGGMLCDEMGLGKTVEVIALLLAHGDDVSMRGKPVHFEAEGGQPGAKIAGPTLIVTPPAILQQWVGEIQDHSWLKVVVYDGLKSKQEEMAKILKAELHKCQRAIAKAEAGLARADAQLRQVGVQQKRSKLNAGGASSSHYSTDHDDVGSRGITSGRGRGWGSKAGASSKSKPGAKRKASSGDVEQEIEAAHNVLSALRAEHQALLNQQGAYSVASMVVQQLVQADIILTTYNVLTQEVHFNMENLRPASSLRHAKRYQVPETPLLQVAWHRLVLDEAQHCGAGLNAVAQMSGHLVAERRWCVTGTPIGPGGLQDIFGSMHALQAHPLSVPRLFRELVSGPYMSGSFEGHERLRALIKPFMWRNSKAATSDDIQLPARTLALALLAMPSAERAFYEHVLNATKAARAELLRFNAPVQQQQQQQQHDQHPPQPQQQHQELQAPQQSVGAPPQVGHRRQRVQWAKSKDKGAELAATAQGQLMQLRLACVHPQLTQYWKTLSNELQLDQAGGRALSMADIMQRMWDQSQMHLQVAERDYCTAANVLASKLLEVAGRQYAALTAGGSIKKGRSGSKRARLSSNNTVGMQQQQQQQQQEFGSAAVAPNGHEGGDGDGALVPSAAGPSHVDGTDNGIETLSGAVTASLYRSALELLEGSYRVGENGIGALVPTASRNQEELEGGGAAAAGDVENLTDQEDTSYNIASWRAWRFLQLNTCAMLGERYAALGRSVEAESHRSEMDEKGQELAETADTAVAKAESRCAELASNIAALCAKVPPLWQQATAAGFPLDCLTPQCFGKSSSSSSGSGSSSDIQGGDKESDLAAGWVADFMQRYNAACVREVSEREGRRVTADNNPNLGHVVLLGNEVLPMLSREEAPINSFKQAVEGLSGSRATSMAHARLKAALQEVSSSSFSTSSASVKASSQWALTVAPDRVLPRRIITTLKCPKDSVAATATIMKGLLQPTDNSLGITQLKRALNSAAKKMEARSQAFAKQADDANVSRLLSGCPDTTLHAALDALRAQVELVRALKEQHLAILKLEVETSNRDALREAIAGAVEGRDLPGSEKLRKLTLHDLQAEVQVLKEQCLELRSKKAYFANQLLEAQGSRGVQRLLLQQQQRRKQQHNPQDQTQQQQQQEKQQQQQEKQQQQQVQQGLPPPQQQQKQPTLQADTSVAAQVRAGQATASTTQALYAGHHGTASTLTHTAQPAAHTTQPTAHTTQPAAHTVVQTAKHTGQDLEVEVHKQAPIIGVINGGIIDPADGSGGAGAGAGAASGSLRGGVANAASMKGPHTDHTARDGVNSRLAGVTGSFNGTDSGLCGCGGSYRRSTGISAALYDWAAPCAACRPPRSSADTSMRSAFEASVQEQHLSQQTQPLRQEQQQQQQPQQSSAQPSQQQPGQLPPALQQQQQQQQQQPGQLPPALQQQQQQQQQQPGQLPPALQQQQQPGQLPPALQQQQQQQTGLGEGGGDDAERDGVECAICRSVLENTAVLMMLNCGHFFCEDCTRTVLDTHKPACPMCRRDVVVSQVFRVAASRASAAAVGRHNPELDPPEGRDVVHVKVLGSWMTKIDALMRRLLLLRDKAPDEKSLVFSQFPAALQLVGRALALNGLGHVSLGQSRRSRGGTRDAVARFKNDPDVNVFLLSLQHGAAGLTLVRANHVFMIDVSTDPAIEQQAVARVHRIGQQRPVQVTRLLCHDTVEMTVLQSLNKKWQLWNEQAAAGPSALVEGEDDFVSEEHDQSETQDMHDASHHPNAGLMDMDGPASACFAGTNTPAPEFRSNGSPGAGPSSAAARGRSGLGSQASEAPSLANIPKQEKLEASEALDLLNALG